MNGVVQPIAASSRAENAPGHELFNKAAGLDNGVVQHAAVEVIGVQIGADVVGVINCAGSGTRGLANWIILRLGTSL